MHLSSSLSSRTGRLQQSNINDWSLSPIGKEGRGNVSTERILHQNQVLIEELESLASEVSELRKSDTENIYKEEQLFELKDRVNDLEKSINDKTCEYSSMQSENTALRNQLNGLKNQVDQVATLLVKCQSQRDKAIQRVTLAQTSANEFKQRLLLGQKAMASKEQEWSNKCLEVSTSKVAVDRQLVESQTKTRRLTAEFASLSSRNDALLKEATVAKETNESTTKSLREKEREVRRLACQISALETERNTLLGTISVAQRELATFTGHEVSDSSEMAVHLRRVLTDLRSRDDQLDRLEKELSAARADNAELLCQAKEILQEEDGEKSELQEELQRLRFTLTGSQAAVVEQRQQLEMLERQRGQQDAVVAELRELLEASETGREKEYMIHEAERGEVEAELRQMQEQVASLTTQFSHATAAADRDTAEIRAVAREAEERAEATENQLVQREARIADLSGVLRSLEKDQRKAVTDCCAKRRQIQTLTQSLAEREVEWAQERTDLVTKHEAALAGERIRCAADVAAVTEERDVAERRFVETEDKLARLHSVVSSVEEGSASLKRQLEEARRVHSEQAAQILELTRSVESRDSQLRKSAARTSELEEVECSLRSEFASSRQLHLSDEQALAEKLNDFKEQLISTTGRLKCCQEELAAVQQELMASRAGQAEVASRAISLERELRRQESAAGDWENRQEQLESRCQRLTTQISTQRLSLQQKQRELDVMKIELREAEEMRDIAVGRSADRESAAANLACEAKHREAELRTAQRDASEAEEEREVALGELAEEKLRHEATRDALDIARNKVSRMELNISEREVKKLKGQSELDVAHKQLREKELELSEVRKDCESMRDSVCELREQLGDLVRSGLDRDGELDRYAEQLVVEKLHVTQLEGEYQEQIRALTEQLKSQQHTLAAVAISRDSSRPNSAPPTRSGAISHTNVQLSGSGGSLPGDTTHTPELRPGTSATSVLCDQAAELTQNSNNAET